MNQNKLLSIIVPIYNKEKYLPQCIESILNQTYKNIEIICVDDGSTDRSRKIIEKYKKNDKRIKIFHQKNKGQVLATKAGLSLATGDVVGFVDADDYIECNMYEKLYSLLVKTASDYVYSDFYNSEKKHGKRIIDICNNRASFISKKILNVNQRFVSSKCTNIYKKELIKKAYYMVPDNQSWAEDAYTAICVGLLANRMAISHNGYYHFITYNDSQSHYCDPSKYELAVNWYNSIKELLEKKGIIKETFKDLEAFYNSMIFRINQTAVKQPINYSEFCYPMQNERGKIIIYGAGKIGKAYYYQFSVCPNCKIVAWVDTNYEKYSNIQSPDIINKIHFDYIIVAVASEKIATVIIESIIKKYGCEKNKILWKKPHNIFK